MTHGMRALALALLLACCAAPAFAADKIGYIDMREVIMTSDVGKKASEDIKKIYDKNKTTIQASEAELKKLKDELEKQRTILKETAWKEKEKIYEKKFRDYQLLVKDANEEVQSKEQELSKALIPEIMKVLQAIGEKEKYALILDVSIVPVAYAAKENDLTKRVTEEFNRTYKPKK